MHAPVCSFQPSAMSAGLPTGHQPPRRNEWTGSPAYSSHAAPDDKATEGHASEKHAHIHGQAAAPYPVGQERPVPIHSDWPRTAIQDIPATRAIATSAVNGSLARPNSTSVTAVPSFAERHEATVRSKLLLQPRKGECKTHRAQPDCSQQHPCKPRHRRQSGCGP